VLEANTAPSLHTSEYALDRWAKYFEYLFSSEERIPHWNFNSFKKGKSMIWKNFQLNEKIIPEQVNSQEIDG
jgi:hypothetical protein